MNNYSKTIYFYLCLILCLSWQTHLSAQDIDLELALTAANPQVGVFQSSKATYTVSNTGSQAAKNVVVSFANPNVVLTNGEQPIASQGSFDFFNTQNWEVGTLAAGSSATLTINYFFLAEPFLFGQVAAADGNDSDSTPNNGNGQTAEEDDEAVFSAGGVIPTNLPDLALANLNIPTDGIINAGDVVEYLVDVQNLGVVTATGDYTIAAFLSADNQLDSNDPEVGVIPTGNTPVGTIANVTGAITVPANTATGNYFLILKTDHDEEITESNENNNLNTTSIQIGQVITNPNCLFAYSNLEFPAEVIPGETFTLVTNITNTRNETVTNPRFVFEIFRPTAATTYISGSVGQDLSTFAPNETRRVELVVDLDNEVVNAPLTQRIEPSFRIFTTGRINGEFIFSYNCAKVLDMQLDAPDYDMDIDLVYSDPCFGTNGRVNTDVVLTNNSNVTTAASLYVRLGAANVVDMTNENIRTFTDNDQLAYWVIDRNLAPEESAVLAKPFIVTDINTSEVTLAVEVETIASNIDDPNLDNNIASAVFSRDANCNLTGNSEVDLELFVDVVNPNINIYENTIATFTLTNKGNVTARDINVDIPLSNSTVIVSGGTVPVISDGFYGTFPRGQNIWSIPEIGVGESATLTVDFFFLSEPFLYGQVTAVDGFDPDSTPNNGDGENANEDDEVIFPSGGGTTEKPDLALANLNILGSGSAGEVIDFTIDVRNIGNATATGNYTITAFLSTDNQLDSNDPEVGIIPTGNTPVGTISAVPGAITVPTGTTAGDYRLIVVTDIDNTINESDEGNNQISIALRIEGGTSSETGCGFFNTYPILDGTGRPFSGFDIEVIENTSGFDIDFVPNHPPSLAPSNKTTTNLKIDQQGLLISNNETTETIAGYQVRYLRDQNEIELTKTNPDGTEAFQRTFAFDFPNPVDVVPGNVEVTPDGLTFGGFIVTTQTPTTQFISYALTTDRQGLSPRLVTIPQLDDTFGVGGVYAAPNGDLYIRATTSGNFSLVKLGNANTAPWVNQVAGDTPSTKWLALEASKDSRYIYAGLIDNFRGVIRQINAATGEEDRTFRLNQIYEGEDGLIRYFNIGILTLANGDIIVGGQYRGIISDELGYAYGRITETGTVVWSQQIPDIESNIRPVTMTNDGGFLFAGFDNDFQSGNVTVFKTTSLGNPIPICEEQGCVCTEEYNPVCGSDGVTYGNACKAECAGITDYTLGECPTEGDIDVELSLSAANPNVLIYQSTEFTLTVRNTGEGDAKNVKVALPIVAGEVVVSGGTTPSTSQGNYNAFTDQIWNVGTLAAGQSATLTIDLFFLAKPFLYAQVTEATGNDPDSTPNNGDGVAANEDDEAIFGGTIGGNNCRIILSVFDKKCNDNGTPENPEDDTFSFTVRATGSNGGSTFGFLSPINTFVPVPYGTDTPVGDFPIKDGAVEVIVVDSDNANCRTELLVQPPNTCSNGGGGSDLVLSIDAPATYSQYTTVQVVYTVTNNSTTATANNLVINTPLPEGTTNSSYSVTQNNFDLFNQRWNVGNLAPGATATLTWNIFALTQNGINGFGQIRGDEDKVTFSINNTNLTTPNTGRFAKPVVTDIQLYPTVTPSNAVVTFATDSEQTLDFSIYTLQGQRVLLSKMLTTKGLNQKHIDVSVLATGTYFLKIGNYQTLRLVKI